MRPELTVSMDLGNLPNGSLRDQYNLYNLWECPLKARHQSRRATSSVHRQRPHHFIAVIVALSLSSFVAFIWRVQIWRLFYISHLIVPDKGTESVR